MLSFRHQYNDAISYIAWLLMEHSLHFHHSYLGLYSCTISTSAIQRLWKAIPYATNAERITWSLVLDFLLWVNHNPLAFISYLNKLEATVGTSEPSLIILITLVMTLLMKCQVLFTWKLILAWQYRAPKMKGRVLMVESVNIKGWKDPKT